MSQRYFYPAEYTTKTKPKTTNLYPNLKKTRTYFRVRVRIRVTIKVM